MTIVFTGISHIIRLSSGGKNACLLFPRIIMANQIGSVIVILHLAVAMSHGSVLLLLILRLDLEVD